MIGAKRAILVLAGALLLCAAASQAQLDLEVDPSTGEAWIANNTGATLGLDSYQINSAEGNLDPTNFNGTTGWNSLQDQAFTGWAEGPLSNANQLLEISLVALQLTDGVRVSLGAPVDIGTDLDDLDFSYTVGGSPVTGDVVLVPEPATIGMLLLGATAALLRRRR